MAFNSRSVEFEETNTIGGFKLGEEVNSFDGIYQEAYDNMLNAGCDIMKGVNNLITDPHMMASYKASMLNDLHTFCEQVAEENVGNCNGGVISTLYDQVSQLWDNTATELMQESTRVGQLLPIKAVDFPVLVRQHVALAGNVIMQTEVTTSPVIKKHIEQRWVYSAQDPTKRWEWPQCLFNKEAIEQLYDEGKGLKIKDDPVDLPLYNWSIVEELMQIDDPTYSQSIGLNLTVAKAILTDGTEVVLPNMHINMVDNSWQGGKIDFTKAGGDVVNDCLLGNVDFRTNKITLVSAAGHVKSVVFNGYLSNERNERHVRWEYDRIEREWQIEDGCTTDMPYSLETLEDTKALMNIDLYKKTYADMSEFLTQMEDSKILAFLDKAYNDYKGVTVDPMGYNPMVHDMRFDCDNTQQTVALLPEYIDKVLKWQIDRFLEKIADDSKLDNITYVAYGNPRYISLLGKNVSWVTRAGSSSAGGVKLDYSYGIMNCCGVTVQVVAAKKINAKTMKGIRFVAFPLSKEQYTFKHYKYTTHIVTAQNSAYRAPDLPGGSMTYVMGKSRYIDTMIQGIQGQLEFDNSEMVGFGK